MTPYFWKTTSHKSFEFISNIFTVTSLKFHPKQIEIKLI